MQRHSSRKKGVIYILGILFILLLGLAALLFTNIYQGANRENRGGDKKLLEESFTLQNFRSFALTQGASTAYRVLKEKFPRNEIEAHDFSHVIGEIAYSDRGKLGITLCDASFNYGCFHGFLAAFIEEKGDNAFRETESSCLALNPVHTPSCLHGIGHGVMSWQNYKLTQALKACDSLLEPSRIYCYDGVFMEDITGSMLSVEEHAKRISQKQYKNLWDPCPNLEERYKAACYRQHVFGIFGFLQGDFKKLADACLKIEPSYKEVCFENFGYRVAISTQEDTDAAHKACSLLEPYAARDVCLMGTMSELLFEGKPLELGEKICTFVSKTNQKECNDRFSLLKEAYKVRFGD